MKKDHLSQMPESNLPHQQAAIGNTISVAHIITGLATGGAQRALCNLLHGGLATRFNSLVVSLSGEDELTQPIRESGAAVHSLGIGTEQNTITGAHKLTKIIANFRPDIIQGWMYHGNLAAYVARLLSARKAKLAWNIRHSLQDIKLERPATQRIIKANRLLSRIPRLILYNSDVARKQHERFGFSPKFGHVAPNGIDMQKLTPSHEKRTTARTALGIPLNTLVVGHVARFHPMKNHSGFIQAAIAIANRLADVHFVLIGRGVTLQEQGLRQQIPDHLRARFHLLGERKDIVDLMSSMDVFCLSSSWGEGFPNVIGEAMACRLPCVVTNVGDSAFVVGSTGIVVEPDEKDSLIGGILQLLTMEEDARHSLGIEAQARIKDNFQLGAAVDQYTSIYASITNP